MTIVRRWYKAIVTCTQALELPQVIPEATANDWFRFTARPHEYWDHRATKQARSANRWHALDTCCALARCDGILTCWPCVAAGHGIARLHAPARRAAGAVAGRGAGLGGAPGRRPRPPAGPLRQGVRPVLQSLGQRGSSQSFMWFIMHCRA